MFAGQVKSVVTRSAVQAQYLNIFVPWVITSKEKVKPKQIWETMDSDQIVYILHYILSRFAVGTQKKYLPATFLMSTHNIYFW